MFAKHWLKVKEQTAKYYEDATKATGEVYKNVTAKHDKYKSLMEMVSDYNYPIEKYFYTTKDNYINCLFRISGPKGSKP
jgi:phosphoserine phosphatase